MKSFTGKLLAQDGWKRIADTKECDIKHYGFIIIEDCIIFDGIVITMPNKIDSIIFI